MCTSMYECMCVCVRECAVFVGVDGLLLLRLNSKQIMLDL